MAEIQPERRAARRFDMRLPAVVTLSEGGDMHTEAQNVSAHGVFFYLDRSFCLDGAIAAGSPLQIVLTLPSHMTLADSVRVRFLARVVRVEGPPPIARVGVAVRIESHEFLRSAPEAAI